MNNLRLRHCRFLKRSVSVLLLICLVGQVNADTSYGPLRTGETLSSIVNQNYLVSPYEDTAIMNEILRMNPQAFINNNMGLIKRGVTLTLPSEATLRRRLSGQRPRQTQSQRQSSAQTATQAPTAPRARDIIQTVESSRFARIRSERDQAEQRVKRIESESAAQIATLNETIEQLAADKQQTDQQLTAASTELNQLKQNVADLKQENIQLAAKPVESPDTAAKNEALQQLEASKQTIDQKQQQLDQKQQKVDQLEQSVADFESSIAALKEDHQNTTAALKESHQNTTAALKENHQTALGDLEAANDDLQKKLSEQQANAEAAAANLVDTATDDSAPNSSADDTPSENSTNVMQLETKIAELTRQHQQALDSLQVVQEAKIAEKDKSQTRLQAEIEALKTSNESKAVEVENLSSDNDMLMADLDDAREKLASLSSAQLPPDAIIKENTGSEANPVEPVQSTEENPLLSGPVTKQLLVQELEKPVAFPLWGLLLGAFALGFTSLMMLFTRSRRQLVPAVSSSANKSTGQSTDADATQEPLVFRSGDPAAQDPDIETLRAPQRRDPSRVAVMDPSMAATATGVGAVATTSIAASSFLKSPQESSDITVADTPAVDSRIDPVVGESDNFEAKLKLLIAESYEELGDHTAASEMLSEVQQEGSRQQIAQAAAAINRLEKSN